MACTFSYLDHEARQYDKLGEAPGIPRKIWYGRDAGFRILVLELLGHSLQTIFAEHRTFFGPDQVAALAIQMVIVVVMTVLYALISFL